MHQATQPIIQHLFQVASLEDVSRERLESFVETYPSFGIGHYLLSRKLQAEGADSFQSETQRTCLYFSNPLWLQWLLENGEPRGVAESLVQQPLPVPEEIQAPPETLAVYEAATWTGTPAVEEQTPPEMPAVQEEQTPAEMQAVAQMPPAEEQTPPETPLAAEQTSVEMPPAEEQPVENVMTMAEGAYGDDMAEALTDSEGDTPDVSAADRLLRSIEEAKELRESLQRINEDITAGPEETFTAETAVAGEGAPETARGALQTEAAEEPGRAPEEPIRDEEAPYVLDEPIATAESPVVAAEPSPALAEPAAGITPVPTEPVAGITPVPTEPVAAATPAPAQDLLFEPYHTIDYFASQGIKLTLEDHPSDTLGKQLKSFTEWLKTMRRLPQKDREVVPDRVAEEAIQTYAAHSIEGKDVVTE
ncbi:MAG TPA: hypothetical protein VG605_04980, partial [Puia sp.]|nr:hypothetical protein [Puia sp.]